MEAQLPAPLITAGTSNVTFPLEVGAEGHGYHSAISKDSKLGLVVMQEWWGLNKAIMSTSDVLASQGFSVICPDIYRGKCAINRETAGHLMSELDWKDAVQVIGGAANYLLKHGCTKVGVTGFCMGGALTIAGIYFWGKLFSAAAPFYGIPDLSQWDINKITCPVALNFAELDKAVGFSDPGSARSLEKKLKDAGKDASLKVWENVDHAFMNQDGPNYHKETAGLALDDVAGFMKKYLQ